MPDCVTMDIILCGATINKHQYYYVIGSLGHVGFSHVSWGSLQKMVLNPCPNWRSAASCDEEFPGNPFISQQT